MFVTLFIIACGLFCLYFMFKNIKEALTFLTPKDPRTKTHVQLHCLATALLAAVYTLLVCNLTLYAIPLLGMLYLLNLKVYSLRTTLRNERLDAQRVKSYQDPRAVEELNKYSPPIPLSWDAETIITQETQTVGRR